MSERRRLFRDEAFARRGRSEPIDGLLRITAPHEWLFLAMLGCAMLAVLLWAVFGTIERGLSAPCVLASTLAGEPAAEAQLSSDDARRVAVGMAARVSRVGVDGALDGEVSQVAIETSDANERRTLIRVSLSDVLSAVLSEVPSAALSASSLEGWRDGDSCDLRIVTSRESPIRLIAVINAAPLGLE